MSMIDKAFGIHAKAMQIHAKRAEVLSSNIVNVDTPNYKAKDIDFKAALNAAAKQHDPANLGLLQTSRQHLDTTGMAGGGGNPALLYRNPISPSLDGNTVESHREKAEFSENAIRYQVSLTFMTNRIENIMRSIKGE